MTNLRHFRFDCYPGCSLEAAISLIDGKRKCVILHHLLEGTARFNEIRRRLPGLTPRMLTKQFREPEVDGLVTRTVYAHAPPKVEYRVSDLGPSLEPILRALRVWGTEHTERFQKNKPSTVAMELAPILEMN